MHGHSSTPSPLAPTLTPSRSMEGGESRDGLHDRNPSPRPAVSRGQPSAPVYFVIKSIKLPLSYKTGAEGGGGGWSTTAAAPLTSSHQSEELLLLEKYFPAGWKPPRHAGRFLLFHFCVT